jgi:hypothetical protein
LVPGVAILLWEFLFGKAAGGKKNDNFTNGDPAI